MPIKCEIFPDLRVVLTIITGSIDDKACIDNARSLGKMPGFYSSFDQIIDLTGVTANLLTAEGLQEIAKITPFSPDSRRSFIISESNTVTKTGYFASLSEIKSENMFVTSDRDKAYKWLLDK